MKTKIFAACEELQKSGVKPTLERVREALGGGSFSTINPILKEWKEQQTTSEQPALELPAEAVQAASQAAALIWKIATDKSSELTNSLKHEFEALLKEAVTEKEEALKEVLTLEQTAANLSSDKQNQAEQITALTVQLQKLQFAFESSTKQIEELKAELKQVHNEANTLSAEVQKQALLLSDADSQNAKLGDLLEQKKTELEKANGAAAELNAALKEATAAKDKALQETKEVRKEADKQAKELNGLNLQVQKQQMSLDSCTKQNSELKADIKAFMDELKAANSEAAMLRGQLTVYEKMGKKQPD